MIEKFRKAFLNKKFITFAFIGGFNTVSALAINALFVAAGMNIGISSFISDSIPMMFSYFLNMKFTYHAKPTLKSFIAFPLSYLPGIILNMIITVIAAEYLNVPDEFAKMFALPITIPLNFIVMSFIVKLTSKKEEQHG